MIPNYPNWSDSKEAGLLDVPPLTASMSLVPVPHVVNVGPETLNVATETLNARHYTLYYEDGNLRLMRSSADGSSWEAPTTVCSLDGATPSHLALAFDAQGAPVVFYARYDIIYSLNTTTEASTKVADGTGCYAAIDNPTEASHADTNIMVAYTRDDLIYYKTNNDDYVVEDSIPVEVPGSTGVLVKNIGFRTDKRLQVQYIYFAPDTPSYAPYVAGAWKWIDTYGDPNWTSYQVDPATSAVAWDNGDAQISMIGAVNVAGNLPGPTSLSEHVWTIEVPNDPGYGPYAWVGFGCGHYGDLGDGSVRIQDEYDIFVNLTCDGVTRKYFLQPDQVNTQWPNLEMYEILDDQGTLATNYTWWSNYANEQTMGQLGPYYHGSVEALMINIDADYLESTFFPGKFTEFVGLKQIGAVDIDVRMVHKTGAFPELNAHMRFNIVAGA